MCLRLCPIFSDLSEKNVSLFPILLLHLHENPNAYAEHRSVKIPAPYIYIYTYPKPATSEIAPCASKPYDPP